MLTTTPSIMGPTMALGRSGPHSIEIPTSFPIATSNEYPNQQQVIEGGILFFSSLDSIHWAATDCTALIHALVASFSVIIISELGDKTFIITAIMAMKNSRSLVFLSSALALFLMTVLSVGVGVAATVIPKLYTHCASIILFLCFGIKMLKEAYDMSNDSEESEFDEVKRSLEEQDGGQVDAKPGEKVTEEKTPQVSGLVEAESLSDSKDTVTLKSGWLSSLSRTIYVAPVVIKVFTMVFVAEWGDRSQISTVILAAREDVIGVFVGSFLGHALCTGLAVIGGRFAADMISVRTSKLI